MSLMRSIKSTSAITFGLTLLVCVGCQPGTAKRQAEPSGEAVEDNRSIYRQAIDQAKSLEKRINDRAIDPEEKARMEGNDPAGQDQ